MNDLEDLAQLLEDMRGVWLRPLERMFQDCRERKQRFYAEPVIPSDDPDMPERYGPLFLPSRWDALVLTPDGKEGTPRYFHNDRRWNFSPVEVDYQGPTIALSSCHWENIKVAVYGDPPAVAVGIKSWFEAAFVPPETQAEDQIQNVVHDISDLRVDGDVTTFVLDCGTMPVGQMFALLDHLCGVGATRVELSMP